MMMMTSTVVIHLDFALSFQMSPVNLRRSVH